MSAEGRLWLLGAEIEHARRVFALARAENGHDGAGIGVLLAGEAPEVSDALIAGAEELLDGLWSAGLSRERVDAVLGECLGRLLESGV